MIKQKTKIMEENYQVIDETLNQTEGLEINHISSRYLNEIRKWAKFISIVIFILAGLMLLFGFFAAMIGNSLGQSNEAFAPFAVGGGPGFMIMMIILSVLYFVPAYFLLQFSNYMKKAIKEQNSKIIEMSFKNLKSHYKFIGILMIVVIGIYLIGGLFALIGLSFV